MADHGDELAWEVLVNTLDTGPSLYPYPHLHDSDGLPSWPPPASPPPHTLTLFLNTVTFGALCLFVAPRPCQLSFLQRATPTFPCSLCSTLVLLWGLQALLPGGLCICSALWQPCVWIWKLFRRLCRWVGWDGAGKEVQEGGDMYMRIADSLRSTVQNDTSLCQYIRQFFLEKAKSI